MAPPARSLSRAPATHLAAIEAFLSRFDGDGNQVVVDLAGQLVARVQELNAQIDQLEGDLGPRVRRLAPSLLALVGCGVLTAAKLVGETADVRRFRSKDAYARHNGTAPLPVWSGNKQRYRLSRTGNRQLNLALHRIALTQARHHPDAQRYLARRRANGNTPTEAIRALSGACPMWSTGRSWPMPAPPRPTIRQPPLDIGARGNRRSTTAPRRRR